MQTRCRLRGRLAMIATVAAIATPLVSDGTAIIMPSRICAASASIETI